MLSNPPNYVVLPNPSIKQDALKSVPYVKPLGGTGYEHLPQAF